MSEPFNPAFQWALDASDPAYRVILYDADNDARPPRRPRAKRQIRLSLRGYDVAQVDELLDRAEQALTDGSETRRAWARQALRSARLSESQSGNCNGNNGQEPLGYNLVHNFSPMLSAEVAVCISGTDIGLSIPHLCHGQTNAGYIRFDSDRNNTGSTSRRIASFA